MTGPFNISPRRKDTTRATIPRTPQHDSNPLLFPMNLSSPELLEKESTGSPKVPSRPTPKNQNSRVTRTTQPLQESNPLLFPQGLSFYPKTTFQDDVDKEDDPLTALEAGKTHTHTSK